MNDGLSQEALPEIAFCCGSSEKIRHMFARFKGFATRSSQSWFRLFWLWNRSSPPVSDGPTEERDRCAIGRQRGLEGQTIARENGLVWEPGAAT